MCWSNKRLCTAKMTVDRLYDIGELVGKFGLSCRFFFSRAQQINNALFAMTQPTASSFSSSIKRIRAFFPLLPLLMECLGLLMFLFFYISCTQTGFGGQDIKKKRLAIPNKTNYPTITVLPICRYVLNKPTTILSSTKQPPDNYHSSHLHTEQTKGYGPRIFFFLFLSVFCFPGSGCSFFFFPFFSYVIRDGDRWN